MRWPVLETVNSEPHFSRAFACAVKKLCVAVLCASATGLTHSVLISYQVSLLQQQQQQQQLQEPLMTLNSGETCIQGVSPTVDIHVAAVS